MFISRTAVLSFFSGLFIQICRKKQYFCVFVSRWTLIRFNNYELSKVVLLEVSIGNKDSRKRQIYLLLIHRLCSVSKKCLTRGEKNALGGRFTANKFYNIVLAYLVSILFASLKKKKRNQARKVKLHFVVLKSKQTILVFFVLNQHRKLGLEHFLLQLLNRSNLFLKNIYISALFSP